MEKRVSRKPILVGCAGMVALCALLIAIFLLLSGPERVARRVLTGVAAGQGLSELRIESLDLGLDGSFRAGELRIAGRIDAVSPSVESLVLSADVAEGRVSWRGFLASVANRRQPEDRLPAEYGPAFLTRLTIDNASLTVDLVSGSVVRGEGIDLKLERTAADALDLTLAARGMVYAATGPDIALESLNLVAGVAGTALTLDDLSARSAVGRVALDGDIADLPGLIREASAVMGRLRSAGAIAPATALRAIDPLIADHGVRLRVLQERTATALREWDAGAGQVLLPESAALDLADGGDGWRAVLRVSGAGGRAGGVEIRAPDLELNLSLTGGVATLAVPRVEVRDGSAAVALGVRVGADLTLPAIPFAAQAALMQPLRAGEVAASDLLPATLAGMLEDWLSPDSRVGFSGGVTGHLWPSDVVSATGELDLSLAVHVDPESPAEPVAGMITATWDGDLWDIASRDLVAGGAPVHLAARGRLDGNAPRDVAASARVEDLPARLARTWVEAAGWSVAGGAISASATLTAATDFSSAVGGADLRAGLEEASWNGRPLGGVALRTRADWREQQLVLSSLQLDLLGGTLAGEAAWAGPADPRRGRVDLVLTAPSLDPLEPLLPPGVLPRTGPVTGHLHGAGALSEPPDGHLSVALESASLGWGDALESDGVRLRATLEPGRVELEELELTAGASRIAARGSIHDAHQLNGSLSAVLRTDLLTALTDRVRERVPALAGSAWEPDALARVEARVSGTLADPRAEGSVTASGLRRDMVRLTGLAAEARYAGRRVVIPHLELAAALPGDASATIAGRGEIHLDEGPGFVIDLKSTGLDLALLDPWLPAHLAAAGAVSLKADAEWREGRRRVQLEAGAPAVRIGSATAANARLGVDFADGRLTSVAGVEALWEGDAVATLDGDPSAGYRLSVDARGFDLARAPGLAGMAGGQAILEATAWTGPFDPLAGPFAVLWPQLLEQLKGRLRAEVTGLHAMEFGLGPLRAEGVLAGGQAEATVRGASPDLEADFSADLIGPLAVTGTGRWNRLDLSPVLAARGAAGSLIHTGSVDFRWTGTDGLRGGWIGEELVLTVGEHTIHLAEPARVTFESDRARLERIVLASSRFAGPVLEVSGTVPLASDAPGLEVTARLATLDLALAEPFLPVLRRLSGEAHGFVNVSGSLGDPTATGALEIRNGGLRLAETGQGLDRVYASVRLDEDRIALTRFEGLLGRGVVAASGAMTLPARAVPRLSGGLRFDRVRYTGIPDLSIEADGRLAIAGEIDQATITGDVIVTRGAYTSPMDWTRIVLSRFGQRVTRVEQEMAWDPGLRIRIQVPGNFWIRNSVLTAEMQADALLVGTLNDPALDGRAEVVRGTFRAPFGQFAIRRAVALFDRSRPFEPFYTVLGTTNQAGYDIRLQLSGDLEKVDYEWASTPPLSGERIVSLLTTGRVERGAGGESASAAWILSQGLRYGASNQATDILPIDSLELQPVVTDVGIETQVVAGKNLTDRLSIKQEIGIESQENTAVGADFKLTRRLMLSGRARTGNVYTLELAYDLLF